MQAIDRPTRIQLSVKQENQDALELADEYAANLHVSRSQIFFWALRKAHVAGELQMGGRR
tara:strand:+ start:1958 stop:2137 length:180 start_codon:yes stop_codon:yes gene_type:complete